MCTEQNLWEARSKLNAWRNKLIELGYPHVANEFNETLDSYEKSGILNDMLQEVADAIYDAVELIKEGKYNEDIANVLTS